MIYKTILLLTINILLLFCVSFRSNNTQEIATINQVNKIKIPISITNIEDYSSSKDFPLMIIHFNDNHGIIYKLTYYGGIVVKQKIEEVEYDCMEMKLEEQNNKDAEPLLIITCSKQGELLINIFKDWLTENSNDRPELQKIIISNNVYMLPSRKEIIKNKAQTFIGLIENNK
jgi:hypothetical protein